jgi:adenosylcobinamide-GDP ribazoletransferase
MKAIKTFRDLLSFLTIIPVGGKEDFIVTSAEHLYLFPLIGGLIGLMGAVYFQVSHYVLEAIFSFVGVSVHGMVGNLLQVIPAAMTVAFLLVLTGLQHFDGLVDLGNAVGMRSVHERKMMAHAWTVTFSGAMLALAVELLVFLGISALDSLFVFGGIVLAEVAAKLAMVTVVWIGKPTHKGLGSIFLMRAKRKVNIVAFVISVLIAYYFLGFLGVGIVLVSIPVAVLMKKVADGVFGGVSGDMIGATNEITKAAALVLLALVLVLL